MKNKASVQAVIQNLKDAGCDARTVERFVELEEEGKNQRAAGFACQPQTTVIGAGT